MNHTPLFSLFVLTVLVMVGFIVETAKIRYPGEHYRQYSRYLRGQKNQARQRNKQTRLSEKPNIIIVMTDDQDELLGSMNAMPKTLRILRDGGAHFTNSFVTTPMCCPSRSSFLTGMYTHNHNTYTNNENCSSLEWQRTHETKNFGTYLSNAGYRTGFFGKYLNEYNGTYIPPGWSEWVGLVHNSRFYNYTLNFNGKKMRHGFNYAEDYFTDLIANDSVTFLKQSKQYFPNRPVLMVLTVPAPHGPEDSAPQYKDMFQNVTTHRTPSYDYAPNPDKQWLLQYVGKMQPIHKSFTDILQQKRLQTLQSVDDAVEKVYTELKKLGELDNTYIVYTSDHGYHLGQYGLLKGKAMPYEFDIRVPFYIRGPGVSKGIRIPNIVINLDLAPTFLDMAGIPIPEHMDGRSILKLITDVELIGKTKLARRKKAWRDTFLVERGKITVSKLKHREILEATKYNLISEKERRLQQECERAEYRPPCSGSQQWECKRDHQGNLRMFKCRHHANHHENEAVKCICPRTISLGRKERRMQKEFLYSNVNQPKNLKTKFIRSKRSVDDLKTYRGQKNRRYDIIPSTVHSDTEEDVLDDPFSFKQDDKKRAQRCFVMSNDTVVCDDVKYSSFDEWYTHKKRIDSLIHGYRRALERLKNIRRHLRVQRPPDEYEITAYKQVNITSTVVTTTAMPTTTTMEVSLPAKEKEKIGRLTSDGCQCDKHLMGEEDEHKVEERKSKNDQTNKIVSEKKSKLSRAERKSQRERRRKERREQRRNKKNRKGKGKKKQSKRRDPYCRLAGMECYVMDDDHWKVEPKWTLGPFCFCANAQNNTYWCLRTINDTHNFLYCEFITGFISYYDMTRDPYQLRNAVHDLSYASLQQLHSTLNRLQSCKGGRECNIRTRPVFIQDNRSNSQQRSNNWVDSKHYYPPHS